jgi:hypothetical protein
LLRENYEENKDGRGHAIGVVEGKTVTKHPQRTLTVKNSEVLPSIDKDIVKAKKFKFIPLFV